MKTCDKLCKTKSKGKYQKYSHKNDTLPVGEPPGICLWGR